MIKKFFFLVMAIGCLSDLKASRDTLYARDLKPEGRYLRSSDGVEMISSAIHFGFEFTGSSCILYVHLRPGSGHNYLQYTLDGKYQRRLRISDTMQTLKISTDGNRKHIVWIYKATEAQTGPVFIQKIAAKNAKPFSVPDLPLIEFIGNSITCGAAADPSEVPCGVGEYHDQHNAYFAYGPRLSRMLNANFILSSVSGIGIYRTWNQEGPNMLQEYEKADFQPAGGRNWDFKLYHPKIVSIALGTNDLSDGDGKTPRTPFDSIHYVNNYLTFIKTVRSKYPDVQIVLLSSPMINGPRRLLLQRCLTSIQNTINKGGGKYIPINVFFFEPMQAHGCGGHPDLKDHAIMADELLPVFRKMLSGKT